MGLGAKMLGGVGNGIVRLGAVFQNMAVTAQADGLTGLSSLLLGYGRGTSSGVIVTPQNAINLSFVYQCVRVLSESVATLPGILYDRLDDGGKERAIKDPLYDVLRWAPNTVNSSFSLYEYMLVSLLLWGNSYCRVIRDGAGVVREIIPIEPWRVMPMQQNDLSIVYRVTRRNGSNKDFTQKEMLHVRGISFDGIIGLSPISLSAEAIGLAIQARDLGGSAFANGPVPGLALSLDGGLGEEKAESLKKSLSEETAGGPGNWHHPILLEYGTKWSNIPINLSDAQMLETRRFQKDDIAGIFRVPPHMIGSMESATFDNIEHQSLNFVLMSLRPWLNRIEQAIMTQILDKEGRQKQSFEFLVDSLLRGDIVARYNSYQKGILTGFMTRNEARKLENLNPLEGLDEPLVPLNVSTVDENGNRQAITVAMAEVDGARIKLDADGKPVVLLPGEIMNQIMENFKGAA